MVSVVLKMFDISLIRRNARLLVEESKSSNPSLKNETAYLNSIADHVLSRIGALRDINLADVYPLKNFCNGLNQSILVLKELKGHDFEDIVKAANNISAITILFSENPEKARKEFGGIGDIKGNLTAALARLRTELKNAAVDIRQKVAAAAV